MTFWGNQEFFFEIAQGNVEGMKMYSVPGRKNSISATVLDDLTQIPSNVVTPFPSTTGIQMEAVSSSTADEATGIGVRTLDLHYLDSNGLEQEEVITLDGTTPVNTAATDITFVQWSHVKTIGATTNETAVGNISIRDTAGATTYEYIAGGGNQSLSGKYRVPADKMGYVMGWQATGAIKEIDIRLRATVERFNRELIPGVFLFQDIALLNDASGGWIPFITPLPMPPKATIKLSAISVAAGGNAAGQFDIMLVDTDAKVKPRTTRLR